MLMIYEREGLAIPVASEASAIERNAQDIVSFVDADVGEYARKVSSKPIRRTISIPEWMDSAAAKAGVSLSQVTQDALRKVLGL